jgi:hypothetical protein
MARQIVALIRAVNDRVKDADLRMGLLFNVWYYLTSETPVKRLKNDL